MRRIVLQSQEVGERIRQFRAGRIAAIMSGDTPVTLAQGARQILHVIPLAAFGAGEAVGRGQAGGFDRDPLLIPEFIVDSLHTDDVPRLISR